MSNPLFRGFMAALVLIMGGASESLSRDYYVSTSGSDNSSGTVSSPWRTLQKAANSVQAGDVVHVSAGTYSGMHISRDGSKSNPITFTSDGNDVIINGPNPYTPDNINVEGGNYIIIDGFTVRYAPRVGIRVVLSRGVEIRNNVVESCSHQGILTGFAPDARIIDNVVRDTADEHGIYVSNSNTSPDNIVVSGNVVSGAGQTGIHVNGDCWAGGDGIIDGIVVERNYITDCGAKGMDFASVRNGVIENNVFANNGRNGGAGAIHIYGEIGCGIPSRDNVIVNNTIFEDRVAGVRFTDGSTNNEVFNNLIVTLNSAQIDDEVGGNVVDGPTNITSHSTSGLFQDAWAKNFELVDGSTAIDAGATWFMGSQSPDIDIEGQTRTPAPDVGAYEFGENTATGIGSVPIGKTQLHQNSPNPFNPTTTIAYEVGGSGSRVSIAVYDARGARIKRLVDQFQPGGRHSVLWDGRDDHGRQVASGVYFYRMTTSDFTRTQKMVLVK